MGLGPAGKRLCTDGNHKKIKLFTIIITWFVVAAAAVCGALVCEHFKFSQILAKTMRTWQANLFVSVRVCEACLFSSHKN